MVNCSVLAGSIHFVALNGIVTGVGQDKGENNDVKHNPPRNGIVQFPFVPVQFTSGTCRSFIEMKQQSKISTGFDRKIRK